MPEPRNHKLDIVNVTTGRPQPIRASAEISSMKQVLQTKAGKTLLIAEGQYRKQGGGQTLLGIDLDEGLSYVLDFKDTPPPSLTVETGDGRLVSYFKGDPY